MSRVFSLAALLLISACEPIVVASPELQREFLDWRFGMFVSFALGTFHDREWANGYEDPEVFAPSRLDAGQWADAAVSAGMQYAVITAKHTGGWALWDSEYTDHDASAFINFRNGRGDVVREFLEAFRARGIKVGIYYCFPGDYANRLGNTLPEGMPPLHGYPPEAQGDLLGFTRLQLTELLTGYGPLDLVWIDQYRSRFVSKREWREIRNHIKALQPGAYIIANNGRSFSAGDIHSYEYPLFRDTDPESGFPPPGNRYPAEVTDVIGPSWFWNPGHRHAPAKPLDEILAMLHTANARNANYMLSVSPDTSGLLSDAVVRRLAEVGAAMALPAQGARADAR